MDKAYNLLPLQEAILDVYEAIRVICDRHGLRYYASGGTALGAMRHGGFIPWDDDLDLEMPREDFERFCALANAELPADLRLMTWSNTYGYDYLFAKVICTDAGRVGSIEEKTGLSLTQGLFVDIFVADYFPKGRIAQIKRIVSRAVVKMRQYALMGTTGLGPKRKFAAFFGKVWNFLAHDGKTYVDLLRDDETLCSSCHKDDAGTMGISAWFQFDWRRFRGAQQILPSDYGKMRVVPFGRTTIPVPERVENYLQIRYGDWKKLPPEDKRKPSHGGADVTMPWRLGMTEIRKRPLLSIVIANYNYGRFIEETISSVVDQCWGVAKGVDGQVVLGLPNGECIELIVVDGGSTDNSVEVIKKYSPRLTWWCSEKDKGQSDAFNKGFAHSSGRYLTWVNADDLMVPGSLMGIARSMLRHPDCEWFTGNFFRFVDSTGKVFQIGWGPNCYPKVLQRKNSPIVTFGPSTFFSRRIYDVVGGVDVRFHNTMDVMLWSQFIMMGIRQRRIRTMCWAFRLHAASKTSEFPGFMRDQKLVDQSIWEHRIRREETGYHESRIMHYIILLWRLFDGSYICRAWLALSHRTRRAFGCI